MFINSGRRDEDEQAIGKKSLVFVWSFPVSSSWINSLILQIFSLQLIHFVGFNSYFLNIFISSHINMSPLKFILS